MSSWAQVFGVTPKLLAEITPQEIEAELSTCGYVRDHDFPCAEHMHTYILAGHRLGVLMIQDFDDYPMRVAEVLLALADDHPGRVRRLLQSHMDTPTP